MIPRIIEKNVLSSLTSSKKVNLLLGARQVGKTTLLRDLRLKLEKTGKKVRFFNCDVLEDRTSIDTDSRTILKQATIGNNYLFIDEAQRMSDPGLTFKIIYDEFPDVTILATGSSSFELKNKAVEPLTGRYVDFTLYPFAISEVEEIAGWDLRLEEFLVYGFYPEVVLEPDFFKKRQILARMTESYLFKDILAYSGIRNPELLLNLTKALAYQVGNEVNENELANRLKADRKTVVSYLDILEKGYVISRLFPFSYNPRREIGKNYKVFFLDNGIRNSLIDDFNPLSIRNDAGRLWENFLIMERRKFLANTGIIAKSYFWRTYGGAEVDYLEEGQGKIFPLEIKWGRGNLSVGAKSFEQKYKSKVKLVNKTNYKALLT